ncbi:hypothetical protein BJX68DRAFT_113071 [Aspergillus pseudodeflectus]|uniref:Knr4/Smi1-like domain-containing protein n=1 Tax=Aspergillus pseudodeflectus TaxID=176178 RepID=A0ABR4K5M1_9EURO
MAAPVLLPNLAARFQALIDSLQSNPNITVSTAQIGPPATQAQIRSARRAAHGRLPSGLEEFYSQVGYFKLEWTYTGPKLLPENLSELPPWEQQYYDYSVPQGHVNIIPITQIFGSWEDDLYFPEDGEGEGECDPNDPPYEEDDKMEEEEDWRFRFAHLKPLDRFVPEAYTVLIGPKKKDRPQKFSNYIAYHYCGEELVETRYTFADYVERLLISRGYWYWVRSLCRLDRGSLEVNALKSIAPQIFPDMDLGLFVP